MASVTVPRRLRMAMDRDCYVTCIAALTDLPVEFLRQFVPAARAPQRTWGAYERNIKRILRYHGLGVAHVRQAPRGFALGCFPIGPQNEHIVIVKDGRVWHDPAPKGERFPYRPFNMFYLIVPLA